MKKMISAVLILALVFSLCACGETEPEQDTPGKIYPIKSESELMAEAVEIDPIIFSTTGEENGLPGSIFHFEGKVKSSEDFNGTPYLVITTENGDLALFSPADVLGDPEYFKPLLSDEDYTLPQVGETAEFYAMYGGFSGKLEMPTMYLGANEFFVSQYKVVETESTEETAKNNEEAFKTHPVYAEGMYKAGADIPIGEYYLEAKAGKTAYFCISADSTGKSIIENDNFECHYFIEIEDGDYIELSRCTAVAIEDMEVEFDSNNLTAGMYRVGIDIPAGEYKLTQASDFSAYVCVYDNFSKSRDIIINDNFNNQKYITVKDGQILLLSRCEASIVSENESAEGALIGLEELENALEQSMTSGALSCSVTATEKTIIANMTVNGIDDAMGNWQQGKDLESWPSVKEAAAQFNGSIKTFAETMKYEGMEIILNLVSEADETVIYVTWVDGTETFDILAS